MAVKVADTIKPMGSFNAVDASDVGVVIEGVGRSLQKVIDAGDLKGVDSIIVPPQSEWTTNSQSWHVKKIIDFCLGNTDRTIYIKPPIATSPAVDAFPGSVFNLYTNDGESLFINGICDITRCELVDTDYKIAMICHNPINMDYNHSYHGQDWYKEKPFYIEFTATPDSYGMYRVDVDRWFYLKNKDGESKYISIGSLNDVAYMSKTCMPSTVYEVSTSLSGNISNFCSGSSLETSKEDGLYVDETMICVNATPNEKLEFVALHRNLTDETEFEYLTFYNSNWWNIGEEPNWQVGWITNLKWLEPEINSKIEETTKENGGVYTHSYSFSNIYGNQIDYNKFVVHFENVESMNSFKLEIDGNTMLQKYDVEAGYLNIWINFDCLNEEAIIEWTEDSTFTLHRRRYPYGEVGLTYLTIEFEDGNDYAFGPTINVK